MNIILFWNRLQNKFMPISHVDQFFMASTLYAMLYNTHYDMKL